MDTREECLIFAKEFPTPAVTLGVQLAEEGTISWRELYDLFSASLGEAMRQLTAEMPELAEEER